jgi:sulfur-oxidizing protein SoxA
VRVFDVRTAIRIALTAFALVTLASTGARAADSVDPAAEAKAFQKYFTDKFPKLKLEEFVNGPYSMNEDMHKQWVDKEEFPPYDFALDAGKEAFTKPFKNGKTYADCFANGGIGVRQNYPYFDEKEGKVVTLELAINRCRAANGGIGVRQNYPYFDEKEGKVVTLELAINRCREANGEAPFSYVKDDMASLTAYMAFTSRGKPFDIKIPDDPRARAAFENGREYFYTRRGQLNFSCASCHVQNPGERIRAEILAPALGILNAMPIYRSEWGGMGTISRRFVTCNSQTRGVPIEPQSDEYRDLEYYLSYVSNGLLISGPGARP